jgi:putative chitinase
MSGNITKKPEIESLEKERLALDRFKIEEDARFRAEELKLQREQFEINKKDDQHNTKQWTSSPLFTTIVVTLLTGLGAAIGAWLQGAQNLSLERHKAEVQQQLQRQKQEADLILHAIRVKSSKDARENLIFLSDAKLINLHNDQLEKLRKGEIAPILPPIIRGEPVENKPTLSKGEALEGSTVRPKKENIAGNYNEINRLQPLALSSEADSSSDRILTGEQLKQIMPSLSVQHVRKYLLHLRKAMIEFDITTVFRKAAFLAFIADRSDEFKDIEEKWGPTPSQKIYDPPNNMAKVIGNIEPGDGERFKGRGPLQIMGRRLYTEAAEALKVNLVERPELMATPEIGSRAAAWLWEVRGYNKLADQENIRSIGRQLNAPPPPGLERRLKYYELAKKVFSTSTLKAGQSVEDFLERDRFESSHATRLNRAVGQYFGLRA